MASSTTSVDDAGGADPEVRGWLSDALSILTTVGKVAGTLQGSTFVDFGPRGGGIESKLGNVVFFKDRPGGVITMLNQDVQNKVVLDFPGDESNGVPPETLTVKPAASWNVSPAFANASLAHVDSFGITPCGFSRNLQAPLEATVRASADNIRPGNEIRLGSYLTVQLTDRTVAIGATAGFTLVAIVLLNVRGAGKTAVKIINSIRSPSAVHADPEPFRFLLPPGIEIQSGIGLANLEVVANILEPGNESLSVGEPITDAERALLAEFAASR
jgi:hypothetical protein